MSEREKLVEAYRAGRRRRAHYFDGELLYLRCPCPRHASEWVPSFGFRVVRSSTGADVFAARCRSGERAYKNERRFPALPAHGLMPLSRVRPYLDALVRDVGVRGAAKAIGVRHHQVQRWRGGTGRPNHAAIRRERALAIVAAFYASRPS